MGIPLNDVSAALAAAYEITSASDVRSLADGIGRALAPSGAKACLLARLGQPNADAEVLATWTNEGEGPAQAGARIPSTELQALEGSRPDEPLLLEEGDLARLPELKGLLSTLQARSACVVPVAHREQRLGALVIAFGEERRPAPDEARSYGGLGKLASVALLAIESQRQLAAKIKQINGLYRAADVIGQSTSEQEMLDKAAAMLTTDIGFVTSWLATVDEEAGLLRERGMSGLGWYPGRPPSNFPLSDRRFMSVSTLHGQPCAFDNAQERADAEGWGDTARAGGLRSLAYVPLRAGPITIGVLSMGSTEERFTEGDLALFAAFSSQLTSAVLRLRMNEERDKQVHALADANERQARLLEAMREMSTPVIPVHRGILVLPIVGVVDSVRSAQIMESLLQAIQRDKASVVIIDVTGVPTVDTSVANHLLRSTRAASLLGARCVLVGVSPAVAQTVVQLGVELTGLTTRSNLQAGIAYALKLLEGRG